MNGDKPVTTLAQKKLAAEGLLDYIEGKSRADKIDCIVRFAQDIYNNARRHEKEDNHDVVNQN